MTSLARRPLVAALVCAFASAASAAAAPLRWSALTLVDHRPPYGVPATASSVACPASNLCVAVGAEEVFVSRRPTGGATTWSATRLADRNGLVKVACGSPSLCLILDGEGGVYSSRHPSGGPGGWHFSHPDAANRILDIQCASATWCAGYDFTGNVLTSPDPGGPASAWQVRRLGTRVTGVACASRALCVAVDPDGTVFTSTDPDRKRSRWSAAHLHAFGLSAVACPAVSLCLLAAGGGTVYTSTDPTAGATAWRPTAVNPGIALPLPVAISCPSTRLCALLSSGRVLITTDPAAATATWTRQQVPFITSLSQSGLTCARPGLCVAVDGTALTYATSTATAEMPAWSMSRLRAGHDAFVGIQCPSMRLCVAFDDAGNVVTTTSPAGGRRAWHLAHVDSTPLAFLTCPSVKLCVGVDGKGQVVSSRTPAAAASAWTVRSVAGLGAGSVLSCPSVSFCAGVGGSDVVTSTHPAGGSTAWRVSTVDTESVGCDCSSNPDATYPGALVSVACPTASLCVAGDSNGFLFSSTEPAGGATAWQQALDTNNGYYDSYRALSVTCRSVSLCAGSDLEGDLLYSRRPAGGPGDWHVSATQATTTVTNIVCPAATLCLGINSSLSGPRASAGVVSFRPSTGWRVTTLESSPLPGAAPTLTALACGSARLCAAGDDSGNVLTSTTVAPRASAWYRQRVDTDGLVALACPSNSLCAGVDPYGYVTVGTAKAT